jgi:hypothetical protein
VLGAIGMKPVLEEPSTELTLPAEDMLADLEKLNDAILLKVAHGGSQDVEKRYQEELAPKLSVIRKLVAQKSPIAKNALEDAIVVFREFHITAMAKVVTAFF